MAFVRWGVFVNRQAIVNFGKLMVDRFSVRPSKPELPIGSLSGGNVQRAILARELGGANVRVLVASNPCFGLDFKAVDFIQDRLLEARNNGAAVLLISEDLDQLLDLSDRIYVMSEGQLVHETAAHLADVAEIGRQMAGHH